MGIHEPTNRVHQKGCFIGAAASVLAVLCALLLSVEAHARPVSSVGTTTLTSFNMPDLNLGGVGYTVHRHVAVGAVWQRYAEPAFDLHLATANVGFLLYRHNGADFQANVFAYGGPGAAWQRDAAGDFATRFAGMATLEADAESRRFYGALMGRINPVLGGDLNPVAMARIGVAPYLSEFDEIGAWVMLQGMWHPDLANDWSLTPMLRLMYASILVEVGVSVRAEWMLNFVADI